MRSKICVIILTIAMICSIIGFEGNRQQKQDIKAELSVAQSEIVSLQDTLNKSETDLQQKINENKKLESELTEANKTIKDLKGSEYKFVYLGDFKYTYYCDERRSHICGGSGITKSGAPTKVGTTIAVDPSIIPLGTTVYIEGVGFRTAQDTGGAVKGKHIDILVKYHDEALSQILVRGGVWILVKNS